MSLGIWTAPRSRSVSRWRAPRSSFGDGVPQISEIKRTPAGVVIAYFDKAHRYKIGKTKSDMGFVPSVSTILDKALPKHLSGWAERLGVEGTLKVIQDIHSDDHLWQPDEVLEEMRASGLRYWQRRDAAALKGTSIHKAFETLALGQRPKLSAFPVIERPFISQIAAWWLDFEPVVHHAELMVCSWEHQYAGRMDLLAETNRHEGIGVYDLKTSKAVRDSHHFQTAGYRLAVDESGYAQTTHGVVLRVGAEDHEAVPSWATTDQFIALTNSYLAQKQFERETPREYKLPRREAA
jgi:hypothetical protein